MKKVVHTHKQTNKQTNKQTHTHTHTHTHTYIYIHTHISIHECILMCRMVEDWHFSSTTTSFALLMKLITHFFLIFGTRCNCRFFMISSRFTYPGISDVRSEVSNFQYHSNLCTELNTSLIYALNSIQFSSIKNLFLVECRFCHENPGFYFVCTPCIICCHATQLFKIYHILRLFLIYHNMCRCFLDFSIKFRCRGIAQKKAYNMCRC